MASWLLATALPRSAAAKKNLIEKSPNADLYRIDAYCHFSTMDIIQDLEDIVNGRRPLKAPKFEHVFRKLFEGTPALIDPVKRIKKMDKNGIDMSILVPLPWVETIPAKAIADNSESAFAAVRKINNDLAKIVASHPDRFRAVALLPTWDKEQMIAEFRRAVKELGMVGGFFICGYTAKRPDHEHYFNLDKNKNDNLYAEAVKLDVPLWLHPSTPPIIADYQDEENPPPPAPQNRVSKYQIWQGLTWLHDSSAAMVRMVFAGVFKKHPELKMIIHHHGALIPMYHHRMTYGWDYFEQASGVSYDKNVSKPYMDHFKNFYCDTATQGHDPKLLQIALDFFGPEKLLFGTDAPMDATGGDLFTRGARASVEALAISPEDLKKIYSGNIARLISLKL